MIDELVYFNVARPSMRRVLCYHLALGVLLALPLLADDTNSIGLDRASAVYLNNRGDAFRKKGDLENAIKSFTEAIRLDSSFAWPFNNRGLVWEAKRDFANAIKDFTEAIRLDPEYSFPFNNRGLVWEAKRDFEKAIKDYTEAIRLDPGYTFPYNNRGHVWAAKGDFEKAIQDYTEAIRLDPKYTFPLHNRGRVWESKGEFSKAIEDFTEATQLDPKFAAPHNAIAWIKATCHDSRFRGGKKAVQYATKACELTEWKSPAELDTLAAAYAEAGDFTNAVIWAQTSLEIAPASEKQRTTERLNLYRADQPYHQLPKQ